LCVGAASCPGSPGLTPGGRKGLGSCSLQLDDLYVGLAATL
jgi:hypothetical protein